MKFDCYSLKKPIISFLLIITTIFSLSFIHLGYFLHANYANLPDFNEDYIMGSYFNNNKSPIRIDGNGGSYYPYYPYNWTTAESQPWCTYYNGIYYLENLSIDADGDEPCISISDSTVSFVIRNCTLYNADSGYYGGYGAITLSNVDNGQIIENNILSNDYNGIYLSESNDNIIENNTCSNNQVNGIYLFDSHNNLIGNNTCSNNGNNGIYSSNSNSITIRNNTCILNKYNGIFITATVGSQCDLYEIMNNNLIDNQQNGLKAMRCAETTIINNIFYSNSQNGLFLEISSNILIKNNTYLSNSGSGIVVGSFILDICYDISIINNSILNNIGRGIYLTSTKNFNISNNNIKNNDNGGIILSYCNVINLNNNTIWNNMVLANKFGINFYNSEHVNIYENIIRDNTEYGVYLEHYSSYNAVTKNLLSNNGLYCICYEDTCINNIFDNSGCYPVRLDTFTDEPGPTRIPFYYLYSALFAIAFIGIIAGLSIFSVSKRNRMRRNGIEIDDQGFLVMRDRTNIYERYELEKPTFTIPVEVKPYEFYCFTCEKKYIGHQVFCSTCGQRMKLHDASSTVSLLARQKKNNNNKCILCYDSNCPTCNAEMNGEESCFEECPYCESIYHKHCWDKTINSFGKCAFCLETPPSELIPKDF